MQLARVMKSDKIMVLPPADAFRAKEKDCYRKVIYIKSSDENTLRMCREKAQKLIAKDEQLRQMNIQFDINPMSLY